MDIMDLSGIWQCEIPGISSPLRLPGTLDESGIGFPDDPLRQWKVDEVRRIGFYREGDPIVTRLTRKHTFEGAAKISRIINLRVPKNKRLFIECERARSLRLRVNGEEIPPCLPATLSTPYVFEVTGKLCGDDQIVFFSDNSYPGWPRDAIVYASAASDETQTNWNGLLGYVRLRKEKLNFISGVRVYPQGDTVDVCVELDAAQPWAGAVRVQSAALAGEGLVEIQALTGKREVWLTGLPLKKDARRWDLEEGNLYALTVSCEGMESKTVSFGVRDFGALEGRLALNGRKFFLRGEVNCAVFPETGYIPMDKDAWLAILQAYRGYGVNCMRFHSHCPPEAAFAAADELGMLMQPELSHWDPERAFETEAARRYYERELLAILRQLANHPSFVMLTFGNELHAGDAGHRFMDELLGKARAYDGTRLYANGSNVHYGQLGPDPASDFYTAMRLQGIEMRATCDGMTGWLNREYPNTCHDYGASVAALREKTRQPVFAFEVGQYEVLPGFDEIPLYRGVTSPENLKHIQSKVAEKGLEKEWRRMAEATGESSLLCYRAEAEAILRTEGYSGISLLGLQDFPGQGTALVGMMNAHLRPKSSSFAAPERFRAFFRDTLPLALLPRFTWSVGETLTAVIKIANYGKGDLTGAAVWTLRGNSFLRQGELPPIPAKAGALTEVGEIRVPLDELKQPEELTLRVSFCGAENTYPLWVYPEERPVCPDSVYECRRLDEKAEAALRAGGCVFLSPDSTEEALPHSIKAQFSPDFWSVCTFPAQSGAMGQWIDDQHPIFRRFPTEKHNTWQWWPMANQRAIVLPRKIEAIIAEMDSYAFLRPMAKLFECRCLGGRLMVSSLGLQHLQQYPESRALLRAIYSYMASDQFQPRQELAWDFVAGLFTP